MFTTVAFILCLFLAVPLSSFCQNTIHQIFRDKYMDAGLWDVHYSEMEAVQNTASLVIALICLAIFIAHVAVSLHRIRSGNGRKLLLQSAVTQIAVLLAQLALAVVCVLVCIVGLMNIIGAIFTLPIALALIFLLICLLGLAGGLRGLAGVLAMCRAGNLKTAEAALHCVLQFIPLANIVDSLILRTKAPK